MRTWFGGETSTAVLRCPVGLLARLACDLVVVGTEHIPMSGPVVFAPNHSSLIDPPFVSLAVLRYTHYLALDELFGHSRVFDAVTKHFGTIPMSRTFPPLGAMKAALAVLDEGGAMTIFPEGRRADRWGQSVTKRGAAWLAFATGAPVVPVALEGTAGTLSLAQPKFRRISVRVTVLEPIDPLAFLSFESPTRAIMDEWEDAMSMVLGDRETHRAVGKDGHGEL